MIKDDVIKKLNHFVERATALLNGELETALNTIDRHEITILEQENKIAKESQKNRSLMVENGRLRVELEKMQETHLNNMEIIDEIVAARKQNLLR